MRENSRRVNRRRESRRTKVRKYTEKFPSLIKLDHEFKGRLLLLLIIGLLRRESFSRHSHSSRRRHGFRKNNFCVGSLFGKSSFMKYRQTPDAAITRVLGIENNLPEPSRVDGIRRRRDGVVNNALKIVAVMGAS